jgi:predicted nucleotidyltransferase
MINEEITAIKDKLLLTVNPRKIYLFGSFAKNTYNEESDYDFYLVVPDDAGDKIELSQRAYKALRGIRKRPVDIVVGYESSFASRKDQETLEKTVISEGVLLYAESENR